VGTEGIFFTTGEGPNEVFADEAFSPMLRPEVQASISLAANFLMSFSGFASINYCSDVLWAARDEAPLRLFTPLVFFSGGGVTFTPEALRFFNTRVMGSGRG
jgi:hypothetical protein